jgi:hypothetical protein
MSFSAHARHVRDSGLPHRRRVSALRSCVQLYRPIGFEATLSFLAELAGPFHRDEAALLRALDALDASRSVRRAAFDRYAVARRAAKRGGQRSPRPDDTNPHQLHDYWHGAPRPAALHALTFWRRRRLPALLASADPLAGPVEAVAAACLAGQGALTPADRWQLTATGESLRERLRGDLWHDDQPAYFRTRDLMQVLRYVDVAAEAGPPPSTISSLGPMGGLPS